MVGELGPARSVDYLAARFGYSANHVGLGRRGGSIAATEHQFDFNANEFVVRRTLNDSFEVRAIEGR